MQQQNELLDAIEIIVNKALENKNTRVTGGQVKSASGGLATVTIAGVDYQFPYSGTAPTIGSTCRVFIPNGNMSDAFIGAGGGGGGSSTTNYNSLTNKPKINGVELTGNKTSADLELYGAGNEPSYPVTSVNNKTGDVNLTASDVGALPDTTDIPTVNDATLTIQKNGVDVGTFTANASSNKTVNIIVPTNNNELTNGAGYITESALSPYAKSADIPTKTSDLTNDSGFITNAALTGYAKESDIPTKVSDLTNDSGYITNSALEPYVKTADLPTKTSDLTNDSGFITSEQAPVQSVDGATGNVVLNDVKYTEQTLTDVQKTQARANIGAGTSSFSGNYNDLSNKPTIPTVNNGVLTIQKNGADVVTFGANSSDNATANIAVPTKTSDLANDSNYITSSGAPVQSVNGKTGEVVLSSSDVGAISTGDISQTLGTSTTKVPSEKAVSDALSSAGAGDMLKSAYDPNNVVADAGGIVDYVDANGGKIDTIKVNGTAQEIADKTVDINVPTNTNQLTNGAGFITSSQAPVQSVNGKTGNVELTKSDIELNNVANERQYSAENPPPYPVTSVNGMTGDVNIEVAGGGVNIVLSATQPTDLKAGDYWYQIIT